MDNLPKDPKPSIGTNSLPPTEKINQEKRKKTLEEMIKLIQENKKIEEEIDKSKEE